MTSSDPKTPQRNIFVRIFRLMGPGVITGAADDDPSGIATYSIAGAQLGTSLLWTSVVTWPLMGAVQMMCARIGMVTGEGLASGFLVGFAGGVLGGAELAEPLVGTVLAVGPGVHLANERRE